MKLRLIVHLLFLIPLLTWGQLPLYTLYYTHPLAVNPAFTGSANSFRAGINYKNQWVNSLAPLTAYSIYADNFFEQIKSSVGIYVYSDVLGISNYRSTYISPSYSYNVKLADGVYFKAGIQPLLGFTSLNAGSLVFNDQLTINGLSSTPTAENLSGLNRTFFNIHTGILMTFHNFWFGISGYNLLRPQVSITPASRLPIGFGIQTGAKFEFLANVISRKEKKERFIMPHLYFSSINYSKQIYAGTELVYEPLAVGLIIRGNYFSSPAGAQNVTGLAFSLGFRKQNVHANYSYEIPIASKSSVLGPSHEITIRTRFKLWQKPTRRPIQRLDLF